MTPFPRETFRRVERYAPDRRPAEVDLSDNTNLWGPHPAALEALHDAEGSTLSRYPSVWADELRAAAARAFSVPSECVATGCGSDDLLDAAFRAAADPGARVAFVEPTFSMIPTFARMNALEPAPVHRDALSDPSALLEAEPAVIYLCSPNNPTGEVLERDFVAELLDRSGEAGPVVLLDEAYADFAEESRIRLAVDSRRLVVLRTLSKAYGLAGLRVGLALGPAGVIEELEKSRGPYKVGRASERAAVAALEDPEGWVSEIVSRVRRNRERLASELRRRGWDVEPSRANFLLLPLGQNRPDASTLAAALRDEGVAVRPFPGLPGLGDAVRVTVGPWELMERFLEALDRVGEGLP